MKRFTGLFILASIGALGGCASWTESSGIVAHECFANREAANAFARYGMEALRDFMKITGLGNDRAGLGILTSGENHCEPGSIVELVDTAQVYSPEEEAHFRSVFHDAADRFRAMQSD